MRRRTAAALGVIAAAAASVLYCLPHHPSAGRLTLLDALLHIGFFLTLAAALAPLRRPAWTLAALAVLGLLLEVIQWHLGGYRRLEWNDIAANEGGVVLALVWVLWRRRLRAHGHAHGS